MSAGKKTHYPAGRELRVTRREDFDRLFTSGARVTDGTLTLLAAARPDAAAPSRVGVAASMKCGKAVRRNRLKRLCREAFRLLRPELPVGRDYIMVPRPGVDLTLEAAKESLAKLAARLERQLAVRPASSEGLAP